MSPRATTARGRRPGNAWFAGAVVMLLTASTEAQQQAPPPRLKWNNGELLAGNLTSATAAHLAWRADSFAAPLEIRWESLHRIDWPVANAATGEPFSLVLRDGSHVDGRVTAITSDTVSVQSARHGETQLRRSEVLGIRRLKSEALAYGGPAGTSGWDVASNRPQRTKPQGANTSNVSPAAPSLIPPVITTEGGVMTQPYWNRTAFLDVDLPERVDVEFRLRSTHRPEFSLSLEAGPKRNLRIETWDEEVVLTANGSDFLSVARLGEGDRTMALRVCWDTKAKQCLVFTPEGTKLAEWKVPDAPERVGTGIVLSNKGRDLALEFMRIRTWDGQPPRPVDTQAPRIELADGRVLNGSLTALSADEATFAPAGGGTVQTFPLHQIEAMIFSTDEVKPANAPMRLTWADGTLVFGRITAIQDGTAQIETTFSDKPLAAKLDGLRQLWIDVKPPAGSPPEPPQSELDKIVLGTTTLHGRLIADGAPLPRWLAVGSDKPVDVTAGTSLEISRVFPADSKLPETPAMLYTTTGDVLPGSLRGIDAAGLELASPLTSKARFPGDEIRAVQLNASGRIDMKGFADQGWVVLNGNDKTVVRKPDSLRMEPGTALYHPSAMLANEVKLSMAARNTGTFRMRFFASSTDKSKGSRFMVANWGSYIYSGPESEEGQLAFQARTNIPSNKPVRMRFVIQEKQIEFHINGVLVQRFSVDKSAKGGGGMIIEPASLWGNEMSILVLNDFTATSEPGRTWLPDVAEETKMQTLTVPRFRQDDLPRHALLAANGDVLRGVIEAATDKHFAFRAGLESLTVPRDRVKAVIWLQKPSAEATAPTLAISKNKALDQRLERRIRYSSAPLSSLIGALQREAPGLKIELPKTTDNRRFPMQFGGQTVGEALTEIAGLFGLRVRNADDGTVVLEPKPVVPKDLLPRTFWLTGHAIHSSAEAREKLIAAGAAFPDDASVTLDAEARQLHSINTPANQEKIGQILKSQLGGSPGSPSHWLVLASGARLALSVDRMGPEVIHGSSPWLGECSVPLAQVASIRNMPPEPSPAMNAVTGWKLVKAPEPVLPESGGESDPGLGKDAKDFKLPLLAGGDFELGQNKGKVVVLDFWATWCGPCIMSLPPLIEAMAPFPNDQVVFVALNQGEPAEQVKKFIETRGWKLTVALDSAQSVGRQYGVEGIPHTVVIGRDGKMIWVKSGYEPEGAQKVAEAVKKALAEPAGR